jgi:hypothetical protein
VSSKPPQAPLGKLRIVPPASIVSMPNSSSDSLRLILALIDRANSHVILVVHTDTHASVKHGLDVGPAPHPVSIQAEGVPAPILSLAGAGHARGTFSTVSGFICPCIGGLAMTFYRRSREPLPFGKRRLLFPPGTSFIAAAQHRTGLKHSIVSPRCTAGLQGRSPNHQQSACIASNGSRPFQISPSQSHTQAP